MIVERYEVGDNTLTIWPYIRKLHPDIQHHLEVFLPTMVSRNMAVLGTHVLAAGFMPSGIRPTTLLNQITTTCAYLEMVDRNVHPDDVGKTWQPSFMKFEQTNVCDLTDVVSSRAPADSEPLKVDFLGLDLQYINGAWMTVLRADSLYTSPFYHKHFTGTPFSDEARLNHTSMLMAALLNGAICIPEYYALIIAQMTQLEVTRFQREVVLSYLEEVEPSRDLDKLFVARKEGFWGSFMNSCLDRNTILVVDAPKFREYRQHVLILAQNELGTDPVEASYEENKKFIDRFNEVLKGVTRETIGEPANIEKVSHFLDDVADLDQQKGTVRILGTTCLSPTEVLMQIIQAYYQTQLVGMALARVLATQALSATKLREYLRIPVPLAVPAQ